ncbi:MAG: glycoside hydrolase N-terminal domain-containing protein [Saprospiraceae bacterium]|nr:glycoside hydrolase N-terminal domain-containing protein [Saprospiraceae bacterium]
MSLACGMPKNKKNIYYGIRNPAQNWNEALPLGNGKLGVMVLGILLTNEFN